ncbi:MAG: Rrf2 family transcriptional regulator [Phycisphaerales bacterium]|jgi:Rrf2 family nitric oxide-sensitive transcriptional repressor|nr:Rrf2 family transcriptional regulator [Phycisphaerales bacterium]
MINQSGEYALRAMVYISRNSPDAPCSAVEIATATQVSQSYLQKILRKLTEVGLLKAQRGTGGGFFLARKSSSISVLDVLNACDSGPRRIKSCPLGIKGHTKLCPLHQLIDQQSADAESVFAATQISELYRDSDGLVTMKECEPNCPGFIQLNTTKIDLQ